MDVPTPNKSIEETELSVIAKGVLVSVDAVFMLMCIGGNFFVLFTVICNKRLHQPSFVLILSVVISHLLVGFVVLPMFIASHFQDHFMSHTLCKLLRYCAKVAQNASVASLIPLTYFVFQRHGYFCKHDRAKTMGMVKIQLGLVWLWSFSYATWNLFVYELVEAYLPYPENPTQYFLLRMCNIPAKHKEKHKIYVMVDVLLMYIIPVLALAVMYGVILYSQWIKMADGMTAEDKHTRSLVTKAGVIFLVTFAVCNIGNTTLSLYVTWGPGHFRSANLVTAIAEVIGFALTWLNVLLLLLFNMPFRQVAFKLREERVDEHELPQLNQQQNIEL